MIKCIAIDDEYLAPEVIESHVQKTPFLQLVATYTNPIDAIPLLNAGGADLLLLDISMPENERS